MKGDTNKLINTTSEMIEIVVIHRRCTHMFCVEVSITDAHG